MKLCTSCNTLKATTDFHRRTASPDGLGAKCKKCAAEYARQYYRQPGQAEKQIERSKAYYRDIPERRRFLSARWRANHPEQAALLARRGVLRRKYGLDVEGYEALLAWSNGGCAICGVTNNLAVDHDHYTGNLRGLLCRNCNTGLGQFKDRIDLLKIAMAYLEYFKV
jgi:Recombination endonuclease VII